MKEPVKRFVSPIILSNSIAAVFRGKDADVVDYEDYHGGVMMKMHKPPHPGEILRELCIEPLWLSITEAAFAAWVRF